MATISTLPVVPIPSRSVAVVFTLEETGTNFFRAWLTDAPYGTPEKTKLIESGETRYELRFSGSRWEFTPEVGGNYVLAVQEYVRGASSHGGSYQNDPNSDITETKVGAEKTVTVTVAQRLTTAIGTGTDFATLALYVLDDSIAETSFKIHGEKTPAIANPNGKRAESAIGDASVVSALAALIGETVSVAVGEPSAIMGDIVSNYNAHLTQASVHNENDTDNALPSGYTSTLSPAALARAANAALTNMRRHMLNDSGQGPGEPPSPGGSPAAYHEIGGNDRMDWANVPTLTAAGQVQDSYRALADLWRAYEGHRVNTGVHSVADSTNVLNALPKLLQLHVAFLDSVAAFDPTVPDTQTEGALILMSRAGAVES